MPDSIIIRGAREHNLRALDLDLPKNSLIVFTGVSGSGKSTLAFDTLFAEGQRLYVESLSTYARQFLQQLPRPKVDRLEGLAPSIAISQAARSHNPRSTVATVTEIYDHLRVLYAAIGKPHCPQCGVQIGAQSREAIVAQVLSLPGEGQVQILAPVVRARRGEFQDLLEEMRKRGYLRARIDGALYDTASPPALDRRRRHDVEIVVDRIAPGRSGEAVGQTRARVAEAVEAALELSEGDVVVAREGAPDLLLSTRFACPKCDLSFPEPTHAAFSFNNLQGMCPECQGLGQTRTVDPERLAQFPDRSLLAGAIPLLPHRTNRWWRHIYGGAAAHFGFSLDTPWRELTPEQREGFLYGSGGEPVHFYYREPHGRWEWNHDEPWWGLVRELMTRANRLKSRHLLAEYEAVLHIGRCPACLGQRLKPESLAVTVGGLSISELCRRTVEEAARFVADLRLSRSEALIAEDALKEVRDRLSFLEYVGLHYLTLDRSAPTLAGGEAQRIRLASQVGSGLVDCLYVLDEPSIGLHYRDQGRLLDTLLHLRDLDNTIIVVEHDEQTIRAADLVVDFGPGAGEKGGQVVAFGTPAQLQRERASLTGQYLAGRKAIPTPAARRPGSGKRLVVEGARQNNLQGIDVAFPLGCFVCVTGVSGSGKSSLVSDILHPALARHLHGAEADPGRHDRLRGLEHLRKAILIDQDPIGRTPRSNPATYTKLFDGVRDLFASLPESQVRGYKPGRFSFNVAEGRCPQCEGHGAVRLESDFLADVWVACEACQGQRFDRETLSVEFKGRNVAEVLDMEVVEAAELFSNLPGARRILDTLLQVGLGYIKLGQPATTLSGGEAQRIKLARELARPGGEGCVYILDEPTTGLHLEDVRRLLEVLQRFVDAGSTVIVVEHHPDVIKAADWIIDLGPEGGAGGGLVVACGTPEEVAACEASHTGAMLRQTAAGSGPRAAGHRRPRRSRSDRTGAISVFGAREHNLKGVNVRIPRHQLTVFSGVSGSGKTSLALDTVYAEGQRRYVESLSSYARQFVDQMPKPKVERVTGLSPGVAIEQRNTVRTPRSTVGTETQIFDYMRVLFARLAEAHCPRCGDPLGARSVDDMVEEVRAAFADTPTLILAPLKPEGNEEWATLLARAARDGWRRVRVDGELHELPFSGSIDRRRHHRVELVVDRLEPAGRRRGRLAEAVERAVTMSGGEMLAVASAEAVAAAQAGAATGPEVRMSRDFGCARCSATYPKLGPRSYSFNHPEGWCPTCEGLGVQRGLDPFVMVPDGRLSLRQGAVTIWPHIPPGGLLEQTLQALARHGGFSLDQPFERLTAAQRRLLMEGTDAQIPVTPTLRVRYAGLAPGIEQAAAQSHHFRRHFARALADLPCAACDGGRLAPLAAASRFRERTVVELCRLPLDQARDFFRGLELAEEERSRAGEVLTEIRSRLEFLVQVGLDYLTLHRAAPSLSGGEAQRVKLAGQLGSGLTGVMYVLDEPTVGIHPRDNERMLAALEGLRDLGNTVMVVEHDPQTLERADYLVDFGPGAGPSGGHVVATGPPATFRRSRRSLTAALLRHELAVPVPTQRRPVPPELARGPVSGFPALVIEGAQHNNLKDLTVALPLGRLVCVTGPSGSGKSSLVNDILYEELSFRLTGRNTNPGHHRAILGYEELTKAISIDQSPIGASPRSNPATYAGVFDLIRGLFSLLPESKLRGYTPRRFSFNAAGGRCETCWGMGYRVVEMHFLPDVWVECEECHGRRYSPETLDIRFRGKSIADVLGLSVDEALELFSGLPRIRGILQVLSDVGLGYLPLGQSAPTLSGGEAQRVKIASELIRPSRGSTLYLLDEPTTGLHVADICKLLKVLNHLVDVGNSVVLVEHNLDVMKTADWLLDLGPEGGEAGGYLVAAGTPEAVAACPRSATAPYLRRALEESPRAAREAWTPPSRRRAPGEDEGLPEAARARRPWEVDGRLWHTRDRVNERGEAPAWHDETLVEFAALMEGLPGARPARWDQRARVEFPPPAGSGWFARARTDRKWYLELQFRLPKGAFDAGDLSDDLALPTWDQLEGLAIYGRESRVRVYTYARDFDRVVIQAHFPGDVTGAAFVAFVRQAWGLASSSPGPLSLGAGSAGGTRERG